MYFDLEDPNSIARTLRELMKSPEIRAQLAQAAYNRAQAFSWKRCADETLGFLARIARESHRG
jgi:glycosyltransferase involved in cell wall biosynthesis